MRYIGLFLILFLSSFTIAQDVHKAKVIGNAYLISYHQGGAELPQEYKMPQPYQVTLYVVELKDSTAKPKFVQKIQTDVNGLFEVELDPGMYGFVTEPDMKKLEKGQVLPTGFSEVSEHESHNSSWTSNVELPLVLKEGESRRISITHSSTSVCYMCP